MVDEPKSQAAGLNARPIRSPQPVTVAMGFDDAYVPHVAAVIASIVQRGNAGDFRFLLLNTGGIAEARRALVESIAPHADFRWIEVGEHHLPELKVKGAIAHVNRATFLRLALERVAPADCERVIYLDADLVAPGDLRKLWAIDIHENVLAAVRDCFIDADFFADRWKFAPAQRGYFNAGVLLINLRRVREESLFSQALKFVLENNPPFADQDALNWAVWNRWCEIDPVWNVQRHMAIPALIKTLPDDCRLNGRAPAIVHYTGPEKPWLKGVYHPWAWLYWRALARTPFFSEVKETQKIGLKEMARIWLRWKRRAPLRVGKGVEEKWGAA